MRVAILGVLSLVIAGLRLKNEALFYANAGQQYQSDRQSDSRLFFHASSPTANT
jgi:hypothetical protein